MNAADELFRWRNTPENREWVAKYLENLRSDAPTDVRTKLRFLETRYCNVTTDEEKAEIRQMSFIEELKA